MAPLPFMLTAHVGSLLFVARPGNDILTAVSAGEGALPSTKTFGTVTAALESAEAGDGLLIMAEDMLPVTPGVPQQNSSVVVTGEQWAAIRAKQLKCYLEFPRFAPPPTGAEDAAPQPLPTAQTLWERVAVSAPGGLGSGLPPLALLHPHKHVDFVQLPPAMLATADLVIAKVAGFDTASFGLPPPNATWPMLARTSPTLMLAATQLSYCRRRRFAPSASWMAVVAHVLTFASGGTWKAKTGMPLWTPAVTTSFGRLEVLPADAERQALLRGVQFYRSSRLLPTAERATELAQLGTLSDTAPLRLQTEARRKYARLVPPYAAPVSGDGQLGVFEGLTSDITLGGTQPQSNGMRCDCISETSASFAVRAAVTGNVSDRLVATNLLNYAHLHAGFHQAWAVGANGGGGTADGRPWVISGDTFGIKSWTTSKGAYELFYKDDDARGLLAAIATAGLLQSERWHSTLATGVLGNLRITPHDGFGPRSSAFAKLVDAAGFDPRKGWRQYYDSQSAGDDKGGAISPHYQSYIWAAFLWAYGRSGFAPLLARPQAALRSAMEGFPAKWVPTANGIAMQRARILLPLAFLVRANDTAEHRQWLISAVDGLLGRRHCEGSWCAYMEELH